MKKHLASELYEAREFHNDTNDIYMIPPDDLSFLLLCPEKISVTIH